MRDPGNEVGRRQPRSHFMTGFAYGNPVITDYMHFLNRAAVGWAVSCSAFGIFSLSVSRPKLPLGLLSSPDDVIISQLQTISQLFSSYPPSGAFCQVSKLTIQTEHGRL